MLDPPKGVVTTFSFVLYGTSKAEGGSQVLRGNIKIELNDNIESRTRIIMVSLLTCCKSKVSLIIAPLSSCHLRFVQIMVLCSWFMFVCLSKTQFVGVPGRWNWIIDEKRIFEVGWVSNAERWLGWSPEALWQSQQCSSSLFTSPS